MADWDSLIAAETAQNTTLKPEVKQSAISADNSNFAFGDAMESFMEKNLENKISQAQVDPFKIQNKTKGKKQITAGKNWYNMPKAELTEEEKRDWQVLHMRSVMERGAGNVAALPEEPPEFVQFGVVHTHDMDGRKARLSRKQRAPTIAEMLAKDESFVSFLNETKKKEWQRRRGFNK